MILIQMIADGRHWLIPLGRILALSAETRDDGIMYAVAKVDGMPVYWDFIAPIPEMYKYAMDSKTGKAVGVDEDPIRIVGRWIAGLMQRPPGVSNG